MAFKAQTEQLSDALAKVRAMARTVKGSAQSINDHSAAGPLSARAIVEFSEDLMQINEEFDRLKALPGLAAYVKNQYDDQTYDIAAEFVTMQAAVVSVAAWVSANIPNDGRWLLIEEIIAGRVVQRTFTASTTAPFRVELAALIAVID